MTGTRIISGLREVIEGRVVEASLRGRWKPSQLSTLAAWLAFTEGCSLLVAEQVARSMLNAAYRQAEYASLPHPDNQ